MKLSKVMNPSPLLDGGTFCAAELSLAAPPPCSPSTFPMPAAWPTPDVAAQAQCACKSKGFRLPRQGLISNLRLDLLPGHITYILFCTTQSVKTFVSLVAAQPGLPPVSEHLPRAVELLLSVRASHGPSMKSVRTKGKGCTSKGPKM